MYTNSNFVQCGIIIFIYVHIEVIVFLNTKMLIVIRVTHLYFTEDIQRAFPLSRQEQNKIWHLTICCLFQYSSPDILIAKSFAHTNFRLIFKYVIINKIVSFIYVVKTFHL